MEQKKIENITLHLIVFGTIAIIGVLARQTVLHYGWGTTLMPASRRAAGVTLSDVWDFVVSWPLRMQPSVAKTAGCGLP